VNASIAEQFWLHTEAENMTFHEIGEVTPGEEDFRARVQVFFGQHGNYADLYLDYYFSEEDSGKMNLFPAEMLIFIWRHAVHGRLTAVKLSDIGEV
jgi:hypothetical protein